MAAHRDPLRFHQHYRKPADGDASRSRDGGLSLAIGLAGDEREGRRWNLFRRFTDRARLTVVQAQAQARTLDHDHVRTENLLLSLVDDSIGGVAAKVLESLRIGTGHILLGLLQEGDGVAAQVLTGLGAGLDGARAQVIRLLEEHRRQS